MSTNTATAASIAARMPRIFGHSLWRVSRLVDQLVLLLHGTLQGGGELSFWGIATHAVQLLSTVPSS